LELQAQTLLPLAEGFFMKAARLAWAIERKSPGVREAERVCI